MMYTKIGFTIHIGALLKKNNLNNYSTSCHSLNADEGLSKWNKIKWLLLNFLNNLNNKSTDPSLKCRTYISSSVGELALPNNEFSSPARYLSNHFWKTINWSNVSNVLNNEVNAIEIGCGTGKYGKLLNKYLGQSLNHYTGVDIKVRSEWNNYLDNNKFNFIIKNANAIYKILNGRNFIITQSALEHFHEDITFFKQIANYIDVYGQPIIQIHLLPSASCLYTFLWHGIRQYTPRTISEITSIFNNNTIKVLYTLGGENCNKVHKKFITYPRLLHKKDKRFSDNKKYNEHLINAIQTDMVNNKLNKQPCFYALVMQSNISLPLAI